MTKTIEFKNAPEILTIDGPFNTFRLGTKWFDASWGGDECRSIIHEAVVDGKPAGLLAVVDSYYGPLGAMLDRHAGRNHANQNDPNEFSDMDSLNLREILAQTYGNDKVGSDEIYTVLYLTRV